MKKYVLIISAALAIFSLAGCAEKQENVQNNGNANQVTNNTSSNVTGNETTPNNVPEIIIPENNTEASGETASVVPVDEYINTIKSLYEAYLEEASNESEDAKLVEYRVEDVTILSDSEKAEIVKNMPDTYKESDVLAIVNYSVKPGAAGFSAWAAGNGEESGEWIVNKSSVVTLRNGELTNVGTGW